MSRSEPWQDAPWQPRAWQADALPKALAAIENGAPVVRAVTGAGKSILLAELAHLTEGQVVVTTPSTQLVDDLHGTLTARGVQSGRYYTAKKQTQTRCVVCCNDSLPSLAKRIDPPALWIADEAHKTECDTIHDVILGERDIVTGERDTDTAWVPHHRVGFTATPYRADESERLSLFDSLCYNYGPAQAMRDGVVVPPRVVHYQGEATTIDDACVEMIRGAEGPGVVDAVNIEDAHEFAAHLRGQGIMARAIHSKQRPATKKRLLGQLESGELACLVHVSLLSEGVDMPWLRWLCCRRPISSRVLFAQYIGRGLRTYKDKRFCTVYDPQNLFGALSLDYEAILAGGIEDDTDEMPELPALELDFAVEAIKEEPEPQRTLAGVPLRVIDPATSYVTRMRLALQSHGILSMALAGKDWRREDPTPLQLDRLGRCAWVCGEPHIPNRHQRALAYSARAAKSLDRGTVSDLIDVLDALRRGWPTQEIDI